MMLNKCNIYRPFPSPWEFLPEAFWSVSQSTALEQLSVHINICH